MKGVLSTILKPYYAPAGWVYINHDWIASNPNPKLTKWLINNFNDLRLPYSDENKDINEGLVVHLLPHFKVLMPDVVIHNTDPRAAPAIIEIVSKKTGGIRPHHIRNNPNPGLTQFLIDSHIDISGNSNPALAKTIIERNYRGEISSNTNPDLAEFILSGPVFESIFSNSNPGLTKFIMEHYKHEHRHNLITNTNPLLADLIKSRVEITDYSFPHVGRNSNPGLTEIIKNISSSYFECLATNTNPKLYDFIKEKCADGNYTCGNPLIVKLKPFFN